LKKFYLGEIKMKRIFFVVSLFVACGFGILIGCTAIDARATTTGSPLGAAAAPCPTGETSTIKATPESATLESLLDRFDTLNLILVKQFASVDWDPQTLTLPPWHDRTIEDIELLSGLGARLRAAGAPSEAIEQIDKALPLLRSGVDDLNLANLNAGREALAEATRLLGRQQPAPK
jgi:hypothetical protein